MRWLALVCVVGLFGCETDERRAWLAHRAELERRMLELSNIDAHRAEFEANTASLVLEWETAQDAHRRAKNQQRQFITERLWIPVLSALLLNGTSHLGLAVAAAAWPFLVLWVFYPAAVALINRPAISAR